jgi:hypothetical protein
MFGAELRSGIRTLSLGHRFVQCSGASCCRLRRSISLCIG